MVEFCKIELPEKDRIGLMVRGHANYVKRGDDIVCAGVSAIAQSCLNGCATYGEDIEVRFCKPGRFNFTVKNTTESKVLINAAVDALFQLASQYPQCFKVN